MSGMSYLHEVYYDVLEGAEEILIFLLKRAGAHFINNNNNS
jgi:hypothetical protein